MQHRANNHPMVRSHLSIDTHRTGRNARWLLIGQLIVN